MPSSRTPALAELARLVRQGGEPARLAQRRASELLSRATLPLAPSARPPHPLILLWAAPNWGPREGLHTGTPSYEITFDRGRFRDAHAIVFLLPTVKAGLPILPRVAGQRWVGWTMESEAIYVQQEDRGLLDQLDWTLSHRRDADFPALYVKRSHLEELRRPAVEKTEAAPAVFICSSGVAVTQRLELARDLGLHFAIDGYGRLFRNRRFEGSDLGRETKLQTLARYRFTLAFENSATPDYVTEKIFDALIAGSVPIYLGTEDVRDYLPADDCALLVSDFPTTADLAARVLELCRDETAYRRLLAWKSEPFRPAFEALVDRWDEDPFQRMARRLADITSPET